MNTKYISSRERERERERLQMRKQQIGWKRETDSAREQGKERERERVKNKSGLKISNWQELRGFSSVQNILQAP
jgi:hypothetical protein